VKPVNMGCFQERMPVPAQITITLIVCQNEDNVRPLLSLYRLCGETTEGKNADQKARK
jgi:hypothetical protein